MAIFDRIRKLLPFTTKRRVHFTRYDVVENPDRHLFSAMVDGLSADASGNPVSRERLRNLARSIRDLNPMASGITRSLANDMVGTGPRLQFRDSNTTLENTIEDNFYRWATRIHLAEKLRTMRMARAVDGEAFGLLVTGKDFEGVTLDVVPFECDRVKTPLEKIGTENLVDGILLDDIGNPVKYYVLNRHPGSDLPWKSEDINAGSLTFTEYPESQIIHWFNAARPEQHRGITEFASVLKLFDQLGRFTYSTLKTAEIASEILATLETDLPPEEVNEYSMNLGDDSEKEGDGPKPYNKISVGRGAMFAMPNNWHAKKWDASQPITNYPQFKREIACDIGRAFLMPVNIVLGDSSNYNYASGRLDNQGYFRSLGVTRNECEGAVLRKIVRAWYAEYAISHSIPREIPDFSWFWPGFEHVDPMKESRSQDIDLKNGSATYRDVFAKQGKDWYSQFSQIAAEQRAMQEFGISLSGASEKSNDEFERDGDGE